MSAGSKITSVLKRLGNRFRVGADFEGYLPPQEAMPANLLVNIPSSPSIEKSPFFLGQTNPLEENVKLGKYDMADHIPSRTRWMRDEAKVDKWFEKLSTVGAVAGIGYRDHEEVPAGEYMSTEELFGEAAGWESYDYFDVTRYTLEARKFQADYDKEYDT